MTEPAQSYAGLQAERTALAWRRTGLALMVGSLVAGRILTDRLGLWALVPTVAGVLISVTVFAVAQNRYRSLRSPDDRHGGSVASAAPTAGSAVAVAATLAAAYGLLAFAVVLSV